MAFFDKGARERPGFGCDSGVLTSSSSESSDSPPEVSAKNSITGRFSVIDQKYSIDQSRIVGTGSRASVMECADLETGQRFAVKTMRKGGSAVERANLRREIKLLKEAKHHNIVRLVDAHEDVDRLHLVTDFYAGGDLLERINQRNVDRREGLSRAGCFPEHDAASILRQILRALSYLHGRLDIVHRDLKPENIVFETAEDDSPIRIVDLGIARKHRRDPSEPYMSTLVGTPRFVAPEVLRRRYDRRCDLWSTGAIAFVVLSGRLPFVGGSNTEVLDAVIRGKYTLRTRHWDGVSEEAMDFVRQLLQLNPKKRMTIAQALHHPWMTMHRVETLVEGDLLESPQADDGFKKLRRRNLALPWDSAFKQKLRLSVFRWNSGPCCFVGCA